jgi:hypothetical protein
MIKFVPHVCVYLRASRRDAQPCPSARLARISETEIEVFNVVRACKNLYSLARRLALISLSFPEAARTVKNKSERPVLPGF